MKNKMSSIFLMRQQSKNMNYIQKGNVLVYKKTKTFMMLERMIETCKKF